MTQDRGRGEKGARGPTRACRPGTVYLVGAGPGNPDLITVRGLALVRGCDVLVYDNLMADEFVALSGATEKIYVGKASGLHMLEQRQIGQILVDRARQGLAVVRLKGGDPFVFGRGGEECQVMAEQGVPYEVVPGVTAGIAGPAFFGVPVTHREMSRGVTLVTGHFSKDERVELPWAALAGLDHTLVFYMAVAALENVCDRLEEAGMDAGTPAALLEQATTSSQRMVTGTLGDIAAVGAEAGVKPPALLVVGRVVGLADALGWRRTAPLAGRTVMFTRAADRDYEAVERLRQMGARVIDVPVVEAVRRVGDPDVDRTMAGLDAFGAIAFTSAAAVEIFFDELTGRGMDARVLASHVIVAATRTVSDALLARGVRPDLPVEEVRRDGVADALRDMAPGLRGRVLVPRSSAAGQGLIDALRERGMSPQALVLYDARPADLSWLEVKLTGRRPDVVVFLSGSGVDVLIDAMPSLSGMDPRPLWACVGRQTAAALAARGIVADVVPEVPDVDSMVDILVEKLT